MKTSTILALAALAAGALYLAKRKGVAVVDPKVIAPKVGMKQLLPGLNRSTMMDAAGTLLRPIGGTMPGQIGIPSFTDGVGGLGESDSGEPEGDEGLGRNSRAWGRVRVKRTVPPALLAARARLVTPERGRGGNVLNMPINPYDSNQNTTAPWWADKARAIRNDTTPALAKGYSLQPVDESGNAVNIRARGPFRSGIADQVHVDDHGAVAQVAEEQPYFEPGDASYGDNTTIDYDQPTGNDTYDEDAGSILGLRQDAG